MNTQVSVTLAEKKYKSLPNLQMSMVLCQYMGCYWWNIRQLNHDDLPSWGKLLACMLALAILVSYVLQF